MFSLKSFPQNVHHRSFKGIQASDTFDSNKSWLKVLVDHLVGDIEDLHVEVDDSFECELFGRQDVEKDIEAVTFVELSYFACQFICYWEAWWCIVEASDHMPEVIL